MNTIISNLALISSAAEYFDRSTSSAWKIRAALTNMGVWAANGLVWLENNQPDSERMHLSRIKLSTIRTWLHDCNDNALTLDLLPGNVRKTLGLERETDVHEDACRIAREKCMRTRSAAAFQKYYTAALELAESRRQERERNVERISNLLSDTGWTLEGQVFDSRGYDSLYESPTFVNDSDLYDEDVCEEQLDKFTDTVANVLESMYVECDAQLGAAIVTAKINRLAGYKTAIEQMMSLVGIDKAALAKRQVALEAQLLEQKKTVDLTAKRLDEQILAQLAEMAEPAPAPKAEKLVKTTAAERKAAREARAASK